MPSVLVVGGAGQLGQAIVSSFNSASWSSFSLDLRESSQATKSVVLANSGDHAADATKALGELKSLNPDSFDAVVCVAGGWAGGGVKSEDIFASVDQMWQFNVKSAVTTAHIAANTLKAGGFVSFTGASAAFGPTAGMVAYGITKAATHHLVTSLASKDSGLPEGATVVCICPITLDTATNRKGMPGANFDEWTPLEEVGAKLLSWAQGNDRPASGSFFDIVTKEKKTEWKLRQ